MRAQRGLDERHEQKTKNLIRDTRPFVQKFTDFVKKPEAAGAIILFLGILPFVPNPSNNILYDMGSIIDILFIIMLLLFLYCVLQKSRLPFRLPQRSKRLDYNDYLPGTTKPRKARGIYYFGNDKKTSEEVWFGNEDMRTHCLIFGSTGSGKTEALCSIAYNALVQSSGFIYVDGKGDNSLYAKIFSMVRTMGREDDLLLINFMTGARDIIGPQELRLSNTLNPFSMGSSSMLSNLIVSMMDSGSSGGGDGDMWKGRAIAFVEALLKILVAMRDAGHMLLDANSIRNYFSLERLEAIVIDKVFIRDGQYPISIEHLPSIVTEPIANYLLNLPGFVKERRGKQVSQVLEQHGFITMQLTRIFSSLADTYGHIMRIRLAEVDLKDVVLNRRILVVLLPALEKSPEELSNLGKVIIATLKSMMAAGLGEAVEGKYHDLISRKPTNAPTPYLCILDEYGYYAVKGFAVVPAQARSLGFSVVFAGQDLPAFQKASKEEAASIGANCNIKICMKLEDPTETWEFFMKGSGESYVAQVESFQANAGSMSAGYLDTRGARMEKRSRIDLQDLKEQVEGDAHLFFKSKICRMRMFYADPKPSKAMRLNAFLMVDLPRDNDLYKLVKGIEDFEVKFRASASMPHAAIAIRDELDGIVDKINSLSSGTYIERAVSMIMTMRKEFEKSVEEGVEVEETQSVFSGFDIQPILDSTSWWTEQVLAGLSKPLLDKRLLTQQLNYLSQVLDADPERAKQNVENIVYDLQNLTEYRVQPEVKPEISAVIVLIKEILQEIVANN
jgi:intracellular multiplication protein IcmO